MSRTIHTLKTHSEYFHSVKSGQKNFEVRINDRDYQIGDELVLKEFSTFTNDFTGQIAHRRIDFILTDKFPGVAPGYVVMSLSKI